MNNSLYHEDIKTLAQANVTKEPLQQPDRTITLDNPLCGDRVSIQLRLDNGKIADETHQVKGCLLCRASANAIANSVIDATEADILRVEQALCAMLKGEGMGDWPIQGWEALDVFRPVAAHKSRHDCVMLPFKALRKMLQLKEA